MAEIDKTLPNVVKQPTEVPTPDVTGEDAEVNLVEEQVTTDVAQTELPDGGVEINFDPRTKLNGQQPMLIILIIKIQEKNGNKLILKVLIF